MLEIERLRSRFAELEGELETEKVFTNKYIKHLHKAQQENARLREENEKVARVLCREVLSAIIDAETIVQVEKLSGNIVKEEYAKGQLHSLRLMEGWFERNAPNAISELRRRAGGKG